MYNKVREFTIRVNLAVLTSVLVITNITPSYSEVLGNNPDCDNATLHSYTGPVSLNATWNANHITLQWDGNGADQNYNNTSCIYDDGITLPTPTPTRAGYTFQGWRVVQSGSGQQTAFDLAQFTPGTTTRFESKSFYDSEIYEDVRCEGWSQAAGDYGTDEVGVGEGSCETGTFTSLSNGQWVVSYGVDGRVRGESMCASAGAASVGTVGNPTGSGQYCWCRANGYAADGSSSYQTIIPSAWVYRSDFSNDDMTCEWDCAYQCALAVANVVYIEPSFSGFRQAVFSHAQ